MTKNEIIEQWFRGNVVQDIVKKVSNGSNDAKYDDLVSIVYLFLLEKDEGFIQDLYEKGQYRYYISRMVMLQLISPRSRWYYQTRLFSSRSSEYDVNKPDSTTENEQKQQLYELIDLMPPLDAKILTLYDYYGTKVEVGKELGICQRCSMKKVDAAISKLKREKEKEYERVLEIHR